MMSITSQIFMLLHSFTYDSGLGRRILLLRPLVGAPIGLVGGVAVLLLQLAYEAIFLAPDLLKLVVGELAPLFARMAFELFPLALDDVPVHLRPPPEGQPCPCASSPISWPFTGWRPRRRACVPVS